MKHPKLAVPLMSAALLFAGVTGCAEEEGIGEENGGVLEEEEGFGEEDE